jgi:DNA invertase Pin-like site-specific DNA recombinase
MTSFLLVFVPSPEGVRIGVETALTQLRAMATESDLMIDGPIKVDGSIPSTEAERFSKVAELLERAARSRRIEEGLARAKAEGRRIGRPPSARPVTAAEIVLARGKGRSWRSIEAEYRIPVTSARRYYQNALLKGEGDSASTKEAEHP